MSAFDSTQPTIDGWLRKAARDSDGRNLARTYVWHRGDNVVVGHYVLMPYFIERETVTKRQARGLPNRISCYLIARLALDRGCTASGSAPNSWRAPLPALRSELGISAGAT